MSPKRLTLDVFVDVVCPWCFLGKRHLDAALSLVPEIDVAVRWRPFQLDPTLPPEGRDRARYMLDKFGDPTRIDAAHERLTSLGAGHGIRFAFDRIAIAPNTLDCHRLIRWAGEPRPGEGEETAARRQAVVVDALCAAYFEDGRDLSRATTLVEIAAGAGLDADQVAADLASGRDRDAVAAEIAEAGRIGITGVPCYVLAGRYAVSGAQPPQVLADAMRQTAA